MEVFLTFMFIFVLIAVVSCLLDWGTSGNGEVAAGIIEEATYTIVDTTEIIHDLCDDNDSYDD